MKRNNLYTNIASNKPLIQKERYKKHYPFVELMKRKNACKIQIVKNGIIHLLAKKKKKYVVVAKVYTNEWDCIYLSATNLLLEPFWGKRAYWEVIEYYNSIYEAIVFKSDRIENGKIIKGENMPINPQMVKKQVQKYMHRVFNKDSYLLLHKSVFKFQQIINQLQINLKQ